MKKNIFFVLKASILWGKILTVFYTEALCNPLSSNKVNLLQDNDSIATTYNNKLFWECVNRIIVLIKENHPRYVDKTYLYELENVLDLIEEDQLVIQNKSDLIRELKKFCNLFEDGHLGVYDKEIESNDTIESKFIVSYNAEHDFYFIKIPTFRDDKFFSHKNLDKVVADFHKRECKALVFDLQNNSGGSRKNCCLVIEKFFGKGYVNNKMKKYYTTNPMDVYLRLSEGNILWMKESGSSNSYIKNLKKGLLKNHLWAISSRVSEYDTVNEQVTISSFKGTVICLTNDGCGSACLMFIDDLKVLIEDNNKLLQVGLPTFCDTGYSEASSEEIGHDIILVFPIKKFVGRKRKPYERYVPDIAYFLPITYDSFSNYVYPKLIKPNHY